MWEHFLVVETIETHELTWWCSRSWLSFCFFKVIEKKDFTSLKFYSYFLHTVMCRDTFCWGGGGLLTNWPTIFTKLLLKEKGHRKHCGQPSCSLANFWPYSLTNLKTLGGATPFPTPQSAHPCLHILILPSYSVEILLWIEVNTIFCVFEAFFNWIDFSMYTLFCKKPVYKKRVPGRSKNYKNC